jgi:hypothetical protein
MHHPVLRYTAGTGLTSPRLILAEKPKLKRYIFEETSDVPRKLEVSEHGILLTEGGRKRYITMVPQEEKTQITYIPCTMREEEI